MPQLILYPGLPTEHVYDLKPGSHTIGRATENAIFILDKSLSRKHARIDVDKDGVTVSDLNSTNGVMVNGEKVSSRRLGHGDAVRCGDVPFLFAEDPRIVKELSPETARMTMADLLSEETDDIASSGIRVPGREAAQRAQEKLQILLKCSEMLSSPDGIDSMLERIVDLLFQIMSVDRAAILLVNEETGAVEPRIVRSRGGAIGADMPSAAPGASTVRIGTTTPTPDPSPSDSGERRNTMGATAQVTARIDASQMRNMQQAEVLTAQIYSRNIVKYVLDRNVAVLTSDANMDSRFGAAESILQQSIRSSMCVPLKPRDKVIGALYVDNISIRDGFNDEDLEFLTAFGNQAAIAIENARLYRKIEQEAVTRSNFLRFFPPATIKRIMSTEGMGLGVIETEVTALFCDITNFTSLSSIMKPRAVVDMLNEYFPVMAEIVFRHEGTLEKYIGDALMAVWGAPFRHEDDVDRAVHAAIEMQHGLVKLNERWAGRLNLQIHIGLCTGPVAAGNIGSERYIQYATIGDTTNVAARICSAAAAGEVLISQTTYDKLADLHLGVDKLPPQSVKGKDEPLQLYRIDWQKAKVSLKV